MRQQFMDSTVGISRASSIVYSVVHLVILAVTVPQTLFVMQERLAPTYLSSCLHKRQLRLWVPT